MHVGEEDVAMVGDTPVDIEGGRALGAFTVAALYGFLGPAVAESSPDATMDDISDLPGLLP
jgi:phosphoglycolate phosphatase-like HAD superfamily hydrolase